MTTIQTKTPAQLQPYRDSPDPSEIVPSDNGLPGGVAGVSWKNGTLSNRATTPQAEAGTDNETVMTPLTTAEAIAFQGGTLFATAAQGALADSAVQSVDPGTYISVDNTTPAHPVVDVTGIPDQSVLPSKISDIEADRKAIALKILAVSDGDVQIYVTPTGNDLTGDGSIGSPFATPQRAWDSLPTVVVDKYVINIADGVYDTSSRSAGSMDRPALIYCDRKKMGRRTDGPGGVMTGSVTFLGQSEAGVILQPGSALGYTRGIYVTAHVGSVAFQKMSVQGQIGAESLLTAHRGTYVHASDMSLDGNSNATFGVIAEAGGILEGLGLDIHHCAVGVQSYQGCTAQLSLASSIHDCSSLGIGIPNGGYVGLTTGSSCSSSVLMLAGGALDLTGTSGLRVTVSGTMTLRGGAFTSAFADLTGALTTHAAVEMDVGATGWSNAWTDYGAGGYVPGMVSWVSPATQSTVATPLAHINGICNLFKGASFRIINNAGIEVAESMNGGAVNVSADSTAFTSTIRNNLVTTTTLTASANRTGITIPNANMPGRVATAPVPPGTVWYILGGSSFTVQLVPGSTGDFMGLASITIGSSAGAYGGVVAIMGVTGLWRVFPLGAVRT